MGRKSAPAPAPDPAIGQAALQQAQYGKEYLDFIKEQHADGEVRQDATDALVKQVVDRSLQSQDTADKWAKEDRDTAAAAMAKYGAWADSDRENQLYDRAKYGGWADEDRANQLYDRGKFSSWADEDRAVGKKTMEDMTWLGQDAYNTGKKYEEQFGEQAQKQYGFASEEQDRYKTLFRPVQDKIVSDAMNWDSDARLDSEAAKAKADVVGNAAQQQQAQQRSMASMGIDPRSGRFQGIDRATSLNTALASAGAQNVTRDNVRSQGIQLRSQAGQLGQQVLGNANNATTLGMQATSQAQGASTTARGITMQARNLGLAAAGVGNSTASLGLGSGAGNGAASLGLGTGAGNAAASLALGQNGAGYSGLGMGMSAGSSALGAMQSGTASFNANNATMGGGYSMAMNGAAGQAGTLNNLYGNQLQGWGMQQQANASRSAGIGSTLGTIAGLGLSAYGMGLFGGGKK